MVWLQILKKNAAKPVFWKRVASKTLYFTSRKWSKTTVWRDWGPKGLKMSAAVAFWSFRGRPWGCLRRFLLNPPSGLLLFSAPLKTDTPPDNPPGRGGCAVLRPWFLEHFSLKSLLAPRRGAKIEGPGFQGPLLGLGGEAKASPTTSKLVV